MPPKGSVSERPIAIELIGPLVDDRAALARTLLDVVRGAGIEPRPGSLEQVAGAATGWAVTTLLEGHGRHEISPADLAARADAALAGAARSAPLFAAPGADVWWQRQRDAGRQVAVFSGLPRDVALVVAERAGLGDLAAVLVDTAGDDGLPRPDALVRHFREAGIPPADATAAAGSPSALLAALAAGIGLVVLVGEGSTAAAMLAERRVARLDLLDGP